MRARRLRRARRKQRGDPEDPDAGDRAEQVQPAAPLDEVLAPRLRSGEVQCEVDEEDDADEVVVDRRGSRACRRRAAGPEDHDPERQDRQDQDEDLVGVAALANVRCPAVAVVILSPCGSPDRVRSMHQQSAADASDGRRVPEPARRSRQKAGRTPFGHRIGPDS